MQETENEWTKPYRQAKTWTRTVGHVRHKLSLHSLRNGCPEEECEERTQEHRKLDSKTSSCYCLQNVQEVGCDHFRGPKGTLTLVFPCLLTLGLHCLDQKRFGNFECLKLRVLKGEKLACVGPTREMDETKKAWESSCRIPSVGVGFVRSNNAEVDHRRVRRAAQAKQV